MVFLLVGLVAKASAWRAADPGLDSHLCRGDESRSSHTNDLRIDTPVASLPVPGVIWSVLGWLARCQYTATASGRTFVLQIKCGSE